MGLKDLFGDYRNGREESEVRKTAGSSAPAKSVPESAAVAAAGALGRGFSDITVFDPEQDLCILIRRQGLDVPESEQVTRYYYESIWDRYIHRNVVEEEQAALRRRVALDVVRAALKEQDSYSVLYHAATEYGVRMFEAMFVSISDEDSRIVVGFRNVQLLADECMRQVLQQGGDMFQHREEPVVRLQEAEVHLPDVLHDLRTRAQANINAKRLDLSLDSVDVVNEDVFCDRRCLGDILSQVVENSVRDTRPGGRISVRIKQNPSDDSFRSEYLFVVRHTGSDKTVAADAEKMISLMGGNVSAQEDGSGQVVVSIRLSFRNAGSPVKHEVIPALQGLRALVVDNDTSTCFSVCKMLGSIGMRPDWIGSGDEAVHRTSFAMEQGDEYHAFIMDWMISDLNGLDTIRKVRQLIGDTKPIILLTAYDWPDIESEARRAGVTAFCSKPLFMSELQDVLTQPYKVVNASRNSEEEAADGRVVLLAEDNELNLELTAELLSEAGYEVEAAADGLEAVDMVRERPAGYYGLVLMDIQMPGMNGYEAAKVIRRMKEPEKANIPIIAMTANVSKADETKVLEAGMNRYLTKPVDIHQLLQTMQEVLK